jgi:predicted ATPase/DNA-binding SARP family transcriptional activator
MEFRILGPLEVRADGRAVEIGGAKRRALLAVLALEANRPVSVERLAVALWGEDAPAGAVKAVQVSVSRLRRDLGENGVLETMAGGYRLVVGAGELDVERFERALAAGRDALAAGDAGRAVEVLCAALQLWRGAPLAEFAWAPFAPPEIRRLEELRLSAVESRVEAELATGRHAELVAELQRLTGEHPWRERLHAQLMLALYRSGRQAEALAAYRHARAVLVEQLGIEPGAELHDVHQAILAHDAALDAPPTPVRRAGTLPIAPNRTIGREREIRAIAERLRAGETRLLTLTGPGGVGKTRLALEAARAVQADFADGAGLVRLAAVGRPQDVPAAIVAALAVLPLEGESPAGAVERFLAVKHLLLVVDNCEHLPGAAPWIGELVAGCPALTVLATSREPLAVEAERTHPVPPLALPGGETDLVALAEVAAVELFCERARTHDAGFGLDAGNVAAVAEICQRLDGLPLAIELAAARCGLLSPGEIAERLDAALGELGVAPRDAPARQRTLRATIDWSHALLSAQERDCFARFAVFSGGATVEAAEAITGAGIDTLDRLVAKSLLVRREVGGRTRLGMRETIRAYAAERLDALADGDAVRERHHRFYLALARRHGSDPALTATNRKEHFARLDAEAGNFAAALEWAAAQDATAPLLELCAALVIYWFFRQRYALAVEWIDRALSRPDGDPALQAHCLITKSPTLWALGRKAEQRPVMEQADALTEKLPRTTIRAYVLRTRAVHEIWNDRLDLARALAAQADDCARATGDPWLIAVAAYAKALASGDLRAGVERAAPLLEQVGDAFHLADLFYYAGYRALWEGSDDDAAELLAHAVELLRDLDDPFLWMLVRGKSGLAALFNGDIVGAAGAFRETLELARELVVLPVAFEGLRGLAAVAACHGDLDRAARLYGAGEAHIYDEPEHAVDVRVRDTFIAPARARHGTEAWDIAALAGAALGFRDVIAYALREPQTQAMGAPIASVVGH